MQREKGVFQFPTPSKTKGGASTVGKLHLAQKMNVFSGPSVGPTETRDLPGTQHSGMASHHGV